MTTKPLKIVDPIRKDSRDDQTIKPIQDVDAQREPEATETETPETKQERNQYQQLRKVLEEHAEFFLNEEGIRFVSIDLHGYIEHYPLPSESFDDAIEHLEYHHLNKEGVTSPTLTKLNAWARSKAKNGGKVYPTFVRVGEHGGKFYFDCSDGKGTAIEIDKTDWRVVKSPPVRFLHHPGSKPIVMPVKGGQFLDLLQFANVTREGAAAIAVWCLALLTPAEAYPMLVLSGEHRSGKSLLCKNLKRILDPTVNVESGLPASDEGLFLLAQKQHVVFFGNLEGSKKDGPVLASIARLSTGGAAPPSREIYSKDGLVTRKATKPVLLNGIHNILQRNDQFDRALVVDLQPIKNPVPNALLEQRFTQYAPGFFGAVLDALVIALRTVKTTDTSTSTFRMQGAMLRAEAAEQALGFDPGEISSVIDSRNRRQQRELLDQSPTTKALLAVLAKHGNTWEGPGSEFLDLLKVEADFTETKYIVQSTRKLTMWFKQNAPELRTIYGVECNRDFRTSKFRGYSIERIPENGTVQLPTDPQTQSEPEVASDLVDPATFEQTLVTLAQAAEAGSTLN